MKVVISIITVALGVGIGILAPVAPPMSDTISVRSMYHPEATTAAAVTQRSNTATLVSITALGAADASCVDGQVSYAYPRPVFTMSDGYGGTNITFNFETDGAPVQDLHGDITATTHGYGTYKVLSPDNPASYQASSGSGDTWQYAPGSTPSFRIHVTDPVDQTSDWYALPQVDPSSCTVSTR